MCWRQGDTCITGRPEALPMLSECGEMDADCGGYESRSIYERNRCVRILWHEAFELLMFACAT